MNVVSGMAKTSGTIYRGAAFPANLHLDDNRSKSLDDTVFEPWASTRTIALSS